MERYLYQLGHIARDLPIVYAGDIFHKWNSPPELINFAIEHLPPGYAIPGQHDLPLHNYEDMTKSAYWTLVKAGILTNLKPGGHWYVGQELLLHAFPWGYEVKPLTRTDKDYIHLAVVHSYIWCQGTSYPGAPADQHVNHYLKRLKGYDAAVFGDNHNGFKVVDNPSNITILNCGTFIRQKADEIDYKPMVGLLMSDGSIDLKYLDTSEDQFEEAVEELKGMDIEMDAVIEHLKNLGEAGLDYRDAVLRSLRELNISPEVREIVLRTLEDK